MIPQERTAEIAELPPLAQYRAIEKLVERQEALVDLAEAAWGVIANAGGGDWDRESAEWQGAAVRWRERYHALLDAQRPVKP